MKVTKHKCMNASFVCAVKSIGSFLIYRVWGFSLWCVSVCCRVSSSFNHPPNIKLKLIVWTGLYNNVQYHPAWGISSVYSYQILHTIIHSCLSVSSYSLCFALKSSPIPSVLTVKADGVLLLMSSRNFIWCGNSHTVHYGYFLAVECAWVLWDWLSALYDVHSFGHH